MMLPPRHLRAREMPRDFPRHLKWVGSRACCVPRCENRPIEVVFVGDSDRYALPMCGAHAHHYREIGQAECERVYGIKMIALTTELIKRSPDRAMKQAFADSK